MYSKFEFKIISKISSPHHPYIVLYGDWLGGRVNRGDVLTLTRGKVRRPLHIHAVDIADSPGKLVLACGHAQESVRIATTGDLLVACLSNEYVSLSPMSISMTSEAEDVYIATEEAHYRRARNSLACSLASLKLSKPLHK
jgi:hypothetical protein